MAEECGNPFLEAVRQAAERNWCVQPYCTTCGTGDFRAALHTIGGQLGGPLADALGSVSLRELTSLPHWSGAIELAVRELPLPGQMTSLLESWLDRSDENIRFFDVVLYKLVRHLTKGHPLRERWIAKGIALAVQTRDFSLVESLVLMLRGRAVQHRQLVDLAKEFAAESTQMQRVLRNACNMETNPAH